MIRHLCCSGATLPSQIPLPPLPAQGMLGEIIRGGMEVSEGIENKRDEIEDAAAIAEPAKRRSEGLTEFAAAEPNDGFAAGRFLNEFREILAADIEATQEK